MANENYDYSGIEQRLKDEAAKRGLAYDPSDLEGIKRNTQYDEAGKAVSVDSALQNQIGIYDKRAAPNTPQESSPSSGNAPSVAQQWNNTASDPRRDALYELLMSRAKQGAGADPNDPIIRAQTDAFAATQERSKRNYLSDLAERQGPLANLQGEQRMASERVGQNVSGFQAELLGREMAARRDEIAQALVQAQGLLSGDQQAALQRELATLNAELTRRGQDLSNDQFLRQLGLEQWRLGDESNYRWTRL